MSSSFDKCQQLVQQLGDFTGKDLIQRDEGYMFAYIDLFKTMCEMKYPWIHNEDGMKLHDLQEFMRVIKGVYSNEQCEIVNKIYLAWSEWELQHRDAVYKKRRTPRTQEDIDKYLNFMLGNRNAPTDSITSSPTDEVIVDEIKGLDLDSKGKDPADDED